MHPVRLILLLLLLPLLPSAQTAKTIVSKQMIVPGEPFLIQYILEDFKKDDELVYPTIKHFRRASDPYVHNGSTSEGGISKPTKNIDLTLVALKPGRFLVEGPKIKRNNRLIPIGNIVIEVLPATKASEKNSAETGSDYILRPGEDPNEKMSKNLFIRVWVNKKICYVGEPVLATFKLYSRLTSKSDIVKNPGFYGFTVQDLINLNDNLVSTEKVNGRLFDVHTVRSVQLYPLRAGSFFIDPMEVMNKVKFSKSAVNKKTEQEVVEGVFDSNDPSHDENTVEYENNISTEKVIIHVKPLPEARKPATFNGATGNFSINAVLEKNELAKNEEGAFIITIKGKGNFTQLSAPVVEWPAGIESFEATTKDSLSKTETPLRGSRTFRFPFISAKAGNYVLPAVSFSFFDPDSNSYKTVTTGSTDFHISNEEKKQLSTAYSDENHKHVNSEPTIREKRDYKSLWIYCGIAAVVLLIIALQLKKPRQKESVKKEVADKEPLVSIEQLLQPAQFSLVAGDGHFYSLLQKTIWDYLSSRLHLSGSNMNKYVLYRAMKEKNIDEDLCNKILQVLAECEAAIFTRAELGHDRQELLNRAKLTLEQIKL